MNETLLLARAYAFAAVGHVDQRRKGARAEPYVNHLTEVAELVARAVEGRDANLVAAGVLHDTLEDTDTGQAQLAAAFGEDIAGLVLEVSDDKSLPAAERKRLEIENACRKSVRARLLKLADKTANLGSLVRSPPADWPSERLLGYVFHARRVAAGLRPVNPWLEARFDLAADVAEAVLGEPARMLRREQNEAIELLWRKIQRVVPDEAEAERVLARMVAGLLDGAGTGEA